MVETGKSNNKHESSPTKTRLKDHHLPLAARTVVPGKEDWASPQSQRSLRTHSQPFPPALAAISPNTITRLSFAGNLAEDPAI